MATLEHLEERYIQSMEEDITEELGFTAITPVQSGKVLHFLLDLKVLTIKLETMETVHQGYGAISDIQFQVNQFLEGLPTYKHPHTIKGIQKLWYLLEEGSPSDLFLHLSQFYWDTLKGMVPELPATWEGFIS